MTNWMQIKMANISVEENRKFNRIGMSVNILILLLLMTRTWNLWTPFVFPVGVDSTFYLGVWQITSGQQTAKRGLMVISQALEDRLPLPKTKLEYTKWNPFPGEQESGEGEDDWGEFGDLDAL